MRRACWWLVAIAVSVAVGGLWTIWSLLREMAREMAREDVRINGWREAIQDDGPGPVARFYGATDPWDQP